MNAHALQVLEFPTVVAIVAERASSALGAARVRALTPLVEHEAIRESIRRVAAVQALVTADAGWHPEPIPELGPALRRLRAVGSVWRGEELWGGATLLRSSRRTRAALTEERCGGEVATILAPVSAPLVEARASEAAIGHAIDTDGTVKDSASPALRRIRQELRGAQAALIALLDRAMGRLEPHHRVPDMSVTVRNGRYVIPVRREARNAVGGIVHDESTSGATLFVEPREAVEFGNRIRALEAEESREVQRVLAALTDGLRPMQRQLIETLEALVELDALYARARYAIDFRCGRVELATPAADFSVRDGRHPILLARGGEVIPFDLVMEADERTLLVSGPNTGGKTVLLKAVGLLSAMIQSGIPAPVGDGSQIPVYDDILADIGDEQSLEASLSTFSAHLKNLREILAGATAESLALIDELGSGTDPAEGAALGGAILEALTARGTRTLSSTHLGQLKLLATEVAGIVNASLQFDEHALAPTYRLIKGVPGRSYGLRIARRLGLPDEILARAEDRLPRGERDLAALLASLERRDAELAERERRSVAEADRITRLSAELLERDRTVRAMERTLEKRSREEVRTYLLDARREVERVIAQLTAAGPDQRGDAQREARRQVEALADEQARAISDIEYEERHDRKARGERPAPTPETRLTEGDLVEVNTLEGRVGQVVGFRGEEVTVAVGGVKLTVSRAALGRRRERATPQTPVPTSGDVPELQASPEVDLRGLRVDDVEPALLPALDAAIRADLKTLRIIHGKGTGALRERVAELLRGDPRIASFRQGAWNEGGAGVTVVHLA